jgi:hypothetical protein
MKKSRLLTWIITPVIYTPLIIIMSIISNNTFAKSTLLDLKINTDNGTSDQKQPAIAMN